MLRFLLDEHIPRGVADALGTRAVSIAGWQEGRWLAAPDPDWLEAALADGLTVVTFDVHTIPGHLTYRAEAGVDNPGVVFVSRRTFAQNDVRGISRALLKLWQQERHAQWNNRVVFLRRV